MNNVVYNNYRDLKFCDSHWHLTAPETLSSTTHTFQEVMQYFSLDRVGLMVLTRDSSLRFDPAQNLKALHIKSVFNAQTPDSIYVYGNVIHYYDERDTADGYLRQVKELYDMGVDGFKILDGKPIMRKYLGKSLCDPIFDKMYAFLEENQIPVTIHIADPIFFWKDSSRMSDYEVQHGWFLGDDKTYPSFEQLHEELNGLLAKFPKLVLCMAHGGFLTHDIDALTTLFEKYENLSIDLTPAPNIVVDLSQNQDAWRAFFKKYQKRIFFGSDRYNTPATRNDLFKYELPLTPINLLRKALEKSPEESFEIRLGRVVPLDLDEEILSDIYFNNHQRLHPHARAINKELVLKNASELLKALKDRTIELQDESRCELEIDNLNAVIEHFTNKN